MNYTKSGVREIAHPIFLWIRQKNAVSEGKPQSVRPELISAKKYNTPLFADTNITNL